MKATRDAFGDQLVESAKKIGNIIAVSADLAGATRLSKFKKEIPDRFIECGIAENNAIGIASGLAEHGFKPFFASFASFLTGKYDTIRCSLAYSNSPVVIVGTHAGLAIGKDGVTQMGLEDMAIMRAIPNMRVVQPATYNECRAIVKHLCENPIDGPIYLRLGRQPVEEVFTEGRPWDGKPEIIRKGGEVTIFSTGCVLPDVIKAAQILEEKKIKVRIVNVSTLKPLNDSYIGHLINSTVKKVVTVEDHTIIGGLGSATAEIMAEKPYHHVPLVRIGLNDCFPESGEPADLYDKYGLTAEKIAARIAE